MARVRRPPGTSSLWSTCHGGEAVVLVLVLVMVLVVLVVVVVIFRGWVWWCSGGESGG